MRRNNIAELRTQHLTRQADGAGGGNPAANASSSSGGVSASTTMLERIKNNQTSRAESGACVFQKLHLDGSIVTQVQRMHVGHSEPGTTDQGNAPMLSPTAGGGDMGASETAETSLLRSRNASDAAAKRSKVRAAATKTSKSRRRTTSGGDSEDGGGYDGPVIYIPVTSDRIRIADMKDALKDEYAARYCEKIGVAPTQQNMALVQKLMPFEKCRVTQSTQQNGVGRTERRNNVAIEPCHHDGKGVAGLAGDDVPYELLSLEVMERRQQRATGSGGVAGDNLALSGSAQPEPIAFEVYKNAFLYPFNLKERFEALQQHHHGVTQGEGSVAPTAAAVPTSTPTTATVSHQITDAEALAVQDALLRRLREFSGRAGVSDVSGAPQMQPNAAVPEDELRQIEAQLGTRSGEHGDARRPVKRGTAAPLPQPPPPRQPGAPRSTVGGNQTTASRLPVVASASGSSGARISDRRVVLDVAERSPPTSPSAAAAAALSPLSSGGDAAVSASPLARVNDARVLLELNQPWIAVEASEVRALQLAFARDFPFSRFETRLESGEILEMKGATMHDSLTNMIVAAISFTHCAYLSPLSRAQTGRLDASERDSRFLHLCRLAVQYMQQEQRQALSMESLPVCLLEVRVVVAAVFSTKLPLFAKSVLGIETLRRIDDCLVALLDPFGLHSHIVVLETTQQAAQALRTKRRPQKLSSFATTPLIQFIVGDGARSTEAKRLMRSSSGEAQRGLDELRTHLTPSIRAELLRVISEDKLSVTTGRGV